jgi:two-component system sensor histidine kinase KdpD
MQAICAEVGRLLDVRAVLLLPSADGPMLRAAVPPEDRLEQIERAAAQWAIDNAQPAGRGSATLTASDWLFHPLRTTRGVLGVLGLTRDDAREPVRSDQVPLLMSLLDQASIALDRMELEEASLHARQVDERDRLRSALLSSVSHDLRTPLTTILSAAQAMRRHPSAEMAETIETEALRLNRFVSNLLDMVRVEAGALPMKAEATELFDAAASAAHDTRASLAGHEVLIDIASSIPLVRLDPVLLHHCLINLLDNAGRYADPGTPIAIRASRTADAILLSVIDRGPGVAPGNEKRVFETFTRLEGSDRVKHGTGLGLAIVKGFAEAMGLTVEAGNNPDPHGACFTIRIPDSLIITHLDGEEIP